MTLVPIFRPSHYVPFLLTFVSVVSHGNEKAATTVDNFRLLDHRGVSHELYYHSDAWKVVLVAHSTFCPGFAEDLLLLSDVAMSLASQRVLVFIVASDSRDDRDSVLEALANHNDDVLPILIDDTGTIGRSLGFSRARQSLVVDPSDWRGTYGFERGFGSTLHRLFDDSEIAAAVDRLNSQQHCELEALLGPSDRRMDRLSWYSDEIAPLLIRKCVECHRPRGVAPWSMTNYRMVRGFAPMIREVVRTGRMPPWHADPHFGVFVNDRSLSRLEKKKLIDWIEAGAPRGEGPDPLVEPRDRLNGNARHEWILGEPDVVIDIPSFDVPASGIVTYQYPSVDNPIEHDAWVHATEIIPGDRAALHHVLVSYQGTSGVKGNLRAGFGNLGGYTPGDPLRVFPPDAGTFLPANAVLTFQMHYTPYGRAVTDRSRIGIYLHNKVPRHEIRVAILANTRIRIPPNSGSYVASASRVFYQDILVYALLPHAHYRGRATKFEAVYADGKRETLLSVPKYDFNWQTNYAFEEPIVLPAGTTVVHTTWWDNSSKNPANPDPNVEVRWGLQSWHEMLVGWITYSYADE